MFLRSPPSKSTTQKCTTRSGRVLYIVQIHSTPEKHMISPYKNTPRASALTYCTLKALGAGGAWAVSGGVLSRRSPTATQPISSIQIHTDIAQSVRVQAPHAIAQGNASSRTPLRPTQHIFAHAFRRVDLTDCTFSDCTMLPMLFEGALSSCVLLSNAGLYYATVSSAALTCVHPTQRAVAPPSRLGGQSPREGCSA